MKIIVSVQKPTHSHRLENEWRDILGETKNLIQEGAKAEMLNEGTWQIESESGLPVLASILHAAETVNLSYRVLFADSGVEWKHSF